MLRIGTDGLARDCQRVTRRDFLQVGTLGIGGLSLSQLMAAKAAAASAGRPVHDKSVVMLFLQGGPPQHETFDPNMAAPIEYRAMFGETKTSLPGVTFGSSFPQIAKHAHQMAVVRSYRHGIGSHGPASEHVASGGNLLKASMGAVYSRVAGTTHPSTGMPLYTLIAPGAIDSQYKYLNVARRRVDFTGSLPKAYEAFDPSDGGQVLENMEMRVKPDRWEDRQHLLASLDVIRREADSTGALTSADQFQQQAFEVVVGGVGDAFDLRNEDPRIVERYDTSHIRVPDDVIRKKNKNVRRQHPVALGKQMLMARRLCESGCGFVTVTSQGWDLHGNAFGVNDGMPVLGPAVDKAVSAFLEDVENRGLSKDILLIITGEFGRTPRINKKAGRDHWGNLCPLAFAGGGLQMGKVVGQSDRTGGRPSTEPVTTGNLLATVMHTLLDIGQLRINRGVPTDLVRALSQDQPIAELV